MFLKILVSDKLSYFSFYIDGYNNFFSFTEYVKFLFCIMFQSVCLYINEDKNCALDDEQMKLIDFKVN